MMLYALWLILLTVFSKGILASTDGTLITVLVIKDQTICLQAEAPFFPYLSPVQRCQGLLWENIPILTIRYHLRHSSRAMSECQFNTWLPKQTQWMSRCLDTLSACKNFSTVLRKASTLTLAVSRAFSLAPPSGFQRYLTTRVGAGAGEWRMADDSWGQD